MDNLSIKGIRDDEPHVRGRAACTASEGRRTRPRDKKRKSFAIESRIVYPDDIRRTCVSRILSLGKWWVHGRYETASRRDQAYAAMVRKEDKTRVPRWGYWEYRKRDD